MTQRNITLTLTDAGRAALVNASQNSMNVQFSAIALGSGTAVLDNTAKALTSQQEQQVIFSAAQLGPGQLSVSALFNTDPAAAYPATELALIGDGVLFGVWSTNDPTQALVVRTPGVPYTATITVGYAQLPSQNVSVVIQPLDAAAQTLVDDAVSNAINAHLAAADPHPQYAQKAGTIFTGPVKVPMPGAGDSSALAAPTAWVNAAIAALVNSAPGALDTLKQLADAIGDDPNFSVTLANALALKAALAGSANQVFSVGNATQPSHSVPMGQLASGAINLGNRAVFLANASFVVPQNVTTMWVTGTAAGGGGGGSGGVSGVTSGYSATSGAGGGGAGQFVIKQQISVTPGQTLTIVVGAPGTAGPAGAAGGNGGNGGAGGNNTITGTGVNVTLSGGPGGAPSGLASGNNGVSTPGNAGSSSAGDGMYGLAVPGYGYDYGGDGGCGGSTPFGMGGGVANQVNLAHLPTGYGAGGSGASGVVTSSSAPGRAGAAGSQGFWMLEW